MKGFTLKTSEGCKRLLWLCIVIILLSSLLARVVTTDGNRIKCEQITIDARGAALNAELYYPAWTSDKDSLPAVILTHGGGCTYETFKGIAQELARRGFVVMNTSAYGSGLSEQPSYDEGGSSAETFDIATPTGMLDSLNFVRSLAFVDSTRIGMAGHSTGSKRVGTTAVMDCGFYSFNDIMLNVLYDTFGQEFTEEEIAQDADTLAEERLNSDQMEYYNAIKAEKKETFDTRLYSACLIGSEGAMIIPSQTVSVAGHEVVRNCQVNLSIINGVYDFSYYDLPRRDTTKNAWYTGEEDIILEEWYAIDDVNQTSQILGYLTEESITDNQALAEAIANRSTRMIVNNPGTHSWNFFSVPMAADIVKYFEQTLNYNMGDLTDPSTVPLDANKQTWPIRIAFNFIGMLAMLFMMLPILYLLISREKFRQCIVEVPDSAWPGFNKKLYWAMGAFTVVVGFYAIYKANKNGIFAYNPSEFLCLTRTACLTIEFLKWICIGAAIVLAVNMAYNKKTTGKFGLQPLNISMNIKAILKCILIAFILLGCAYASLMIVEYFFGEQYRLWMTSFSQMKADYWFVALRYALLFFPMYLLIGAGVNCCKRKDIPEWKDTLITVIVNSLGVWLCCGYNICRAWIAYDGSLFSNFACSYQLLTFVPLTVYISRKFYNKTGNLWTGAAFNALLICWAMTSTLGIHDIFVGQSWLSNFLNI